MFNRMLAGEGNEIKDSIIKEENKKNAIDIE